MGNEGELKSNREVVPIGVGEAELFGDILADGFP
jgi:hypothetical protein